MNEVIVTVVVPSFNSGHFLSLTLESIENQTLKNFECIVVDDGSTDDSLNNARRFFRDPRFRLIRHKVNAGPSAARNTGIRAAHGRYVAFLDSDDLMMVNSLEVRVATCRWGERKSDRFVGSYCGSVQIEENVTTAPSSIPQDLDFVDFVSSNGLCPFNANQPMLRRSILRLAGGFNHALKQAEDFDLWQRILRAGYVFAPAKHRSVTYRKRAGSHIRSQPLTHLKTSLAIINSAERPMASDQLDWSEYRMPKPISAYSAQKRKIGRILEFIGMGISDADPARLSDLAEILVEEIPDIFSVNNPVYSVERAIQNGVVRQKGQVDEKDQNKIKEIISKVENRIFNTFDNSDNSKNILSIYEKIDQDRPWFSSHQSSNNIIFIPHKAYHVWTIALLSKELRDRGINFSIVDISPQWRDDGVRSEAAKHGLNLIGLSEFAMGRYAPRAIVTFNDWDPVTRPIVIAAKDAGIRTIAIVEGIQDYHDADVHWRRYAYQASDVVILPGDFDRKYFVGHDSIVDVGGIPRIETLRKQKREWSKGHTPRVLINSNFSYGVLEESRDQWLTDCVEAVRALGMTPVISRHPADAGTLFPEFTTTQSFYECLETCDVSIQRFASGILEALAREVGVIYYNAHGEKVDKFQDDPMDAYVIANDLGTLKTHLARWWNLHESAKANGPSFLDLHTGSLEKGVTSRCAEALIAHQGQFPDATALARFYENLEIIDLETSAFSQLRIDGVALFPEPKKALSKLAGLKQKFKGKISPHSLRMQSATAIAEQKAKNTAYAKSPQATSEPSDNIIHPAVNGASDSLTGSLQRTAQKGTGKMLLNSVALSLLLEGKRTITILETDEVVKKAVNHQLELLSADAPLRAHFCNVLDFARRRYG